MVKLGITKDKEKNLKFLLMGLKGEQDMLSKCDFLTHADAETGSLMWQRASHDYDFNPFGKLIKRPARTLNNGTVIDHKMHYHGWFANLRCSETFYKRYKKVLDQYITHDTHIKRDYLPVWL